MTKFSGEYEQYGRWHPMQNFDVQFSEADDNQRRRISGFGRDTVGKYVLKGKYYHGTARLSIEKQYESGTGDPSQNLGHTVRLHLEWVGSRQEFMGTFHVSTSKWTGSGDWIMTPLYNQEEKKKEEQQEEQQKAQQRALRNKKKRLRKKQKRGRLD